MVSRRIELHEEAEVPVERARAWDVMTDPEAVTGCVPGAAITGTNDDGSLDGTVRVQLGPTEVTFRGRVEVEYDHDGHGGRLTARGADNGGRTRAATTTSFQLTPAAASPGTTVRIDSVIDVSGPLAPFLDAGGVHVARELLRDFSVNLANLVNSESGSVTGAVSGPASPGATHPPATPIVGFRLILRSIVGALRGWLRRLRPHGQG